MTIKKPFLTDADGVLINWNRGFKAWMIERGHKEVATHSYNLAVRFNLPNTEIVRLIEEFNRSAAVAYLMPMPGAIIIMGKIRELDYDVHCISSFGGDTFSQLQRQKLLWDFFRIPAVNVHLLPLDGNKIELLKRWEGSAAPWIEDKVENAIDGKKLGLDAILLRSDHTSAYVSDEIVVADSWYNIFEHITGEEKCQMNGSSYTSQSQRSMVM
jgi:hypothetical protein